MNSKVRHTCFPNDTSDENEMTANMGRSRPPPQYPSANAAHRRPKPRWPAPKPCLLQLVLPTVTVQPRPSPALNYVMQRVRPLWNAAPPPVIPKSSPSFEGSLGAVKTAKGILPGPLWPSHNPILLNHRVRPTTLDLESFVRPDAMQNGRRQLRQQR